MFFHRKYFFLFFNFFDRFWRLGDRWGILRLMSFLQILGNFLRNLCSYIFVLSDCSNETPARACATKGVNSMFFKFKGRKVKLHLYQGWLRGLLVGSSWEALQGLSCFNRDLPMWWEHISIDFGLQSTEKSWLPSWFLVLS